MSIISYWKDIKEVYSYDNFVVIQGKYNHKNQKEKGINSLGLYWKNEDGTIGYPNSRGHLSPMVLAQHLNEGFLQFILFQAIKEKNLIVIDKIKTAIEDLM